MIAIILQNLKINLNNDKLSVGMRNLLRHYLEIDE